jgi:hypothetical protein
MIMLLLVRSLVVFGDAVGNLAKQLGAALEPNLSVCPEIQATPI